ncbi:MAG: CpXC domain-containing protein [Bacilli bacterium]|nr:CpXC domain-containing protein [Bacilli bacterium]
MSLIEKRTIKCPYCGEEFQYDYYNVINVSLNPELKDKVLNASILLPTCPHCKNYVSIGNKLIYRDDSNKFIVCLDGFDNLMVLKEDIQNNKLNNLFNNVDKDYIICGSPNYFDFLINIMALENGIDYRVAKIILRFCEYNYIEERISSDSKIQRINTSGLDTDEEGRLQVFINVEYDENSDNIYKDFPYNLYNLYYEKYKDRLNKWDTFVFDETAMGKFLDLYECDINDGELDKPKIVIGIDDEGNCHVASIENYLLEKVKRNKKVLIKDKYREERKLIYIRDIKEINPLTYPREYNSLPIVQSTFHEIFAVVKEADDNDLNNSKALEALCLWQTNGCSTGSFNFPTTILEHLKLYIISKPIECKDFKEQGEILFNENNSEDDRLFRMNYIAKKIVNGQIYLIAYTNKSKLPSGADYKVVEVPFTLLTSIIKNDPRYSGIIINQSTDDIFLGLSKIETFIKYRILCNPNSLRMLLTELNEEDIRYVGENSFKLIKEVYINNKKPNELEKEYNLSKEKVGAYLDNGYIRLMKIVYEIF